tara:strand:+ start:813 stop:2567 length:1755 start_codon:yes stop_codon:yes gene_type:complete
MKKGAAYWMDLKHFDDEDPLFLAQIQKGITNFVNILCGKTIPVEYALTGDSMTDGKTVYISANIKEDSIDQIVGLALHEASHVLLTDFGFLNQERGKLLEVKYHIPYEDIPNVFTLINFIEDKRIDNFVYSTAPGYQFYYEELYRTSFYNEIVDKNLLSDNFIKPTWDAYFFRIINLFNRNSDCNKLPGLKEVRDLITFKRINTLKSTRDSVELAIEIYNIIKVFIGEEENEIEKYEYSNQENKIKEQVEHQKAFINSIYRKKRVSTKLKKQVNKLINNKTKVKDFEINNNSTIPLIITEKWEDYFKSPLSRHDKTVAKGLSNGKKLLSKLKVRNSTKKDIFSNQKKGKLDHSKVYKASFDDNLFYKIEKEDFKNTFMHISLDLSGSMRGEKLTQTIQTAVSIAYAACNLKNFDVEITLRGTSNVFDVRNLGRNNHEEYPLLAYFFDSRKDSVKKLNQLKYLTIRGMTPEGICLEEIGKRLPLVNHYNEVYLLNISDGLPNIHNNSYNLTTAVNHTKKVVRGIRANKVGILSYYIHDTWDKSQKSKEAFTKMYGKDAKFIDVNNTSMIAKTINNLLLNNTLKVS